MSIFNIRAMCAKIKNGITYLFDLNIAEDINSDIWSISAPQKKQISDDLASFILDQAEKALKSTAETSDKITTRAFTVLLILLPIFSTLIGLLINSIKSHGNSHVLDISFFAVLILVCVFAMFHLITLVFPRNFMGVGRQPNEIVVAGMLDNNLDNAKRLLAFKFNEIKNCQNKINFNRNQNAKRILVLTKILRIISLSALVALLLYLVILYLWEIGLL
jgi:hypothetical protein